MVDPFSAKVQALVVDNVGSRVVGINETTRQGIASVIETGLGVDGDTRTIGDLSGAIRGMGLFDEARAEVIARTETQFAFNTAALESYSQYGVEKVQAIDGDFDEVCAARNGIVLTVEEAQDIEDHPNGTLDWVPVRDDAEAQRLIAEYEAKEARRFSGSSKLVPESTGPMTAPQAKVVNDFERRVAAEEHARNPNPGHGGSYGKERGLVVDPEGKVLLETTGEANRIDLIKEREALRPGNTLTHSHPDEAEHVHFSLADINTALKDGVNIRAFNPNGAWAEFTPKGTGGWLGLSDQDIYFEARTIANRENIGLQDAFTAVLKQYTKEMGTWRQGRHIIEGVG